MLKRKKHSDSSSDSGRSRVIGLAASGEDLYSLNWDPGYSEPLDGFTEQIWFTIAIRDPRPDGMHDAVEGEYLHDLGDAFEAASSGRARLVGSMTTGGFKQFCYYARDVAWLPSYEATLKASEPRRITIDVAEDAAWTLYNGILAEAIQADGDRQVWSNLQANGADLDQPHEIDWFLYFPTESEARSAEALLLEHEYLVQVYPPDPPNTNDWGVTATLTETLSLGYIARMTRMFQNFARDRGGTYDGWGADVEPAGDT